GEARPFLAGMGGRADVVVGRRSLISYAFEPARMLRETLPDRPPAKRSPPVPSAARVGRPCGPSIGLFARRPCWSPLLTSWIRAFTPRPGVEQALPQGLPSS